MATILVVFTFLKPVLTLNRRADAANTKTNPLGRGMMVQGVALFKTGVEASTMVKERVDKVVDDGIVNNAVAIQHAVDKHIEIIKS